MKTNVQTSEISKVEKSEKKDSINLENAKVNLSKAKKELADKKSTSVEGRKSLYKGIENLSSEDQKKRRQKIRNQLRRYANNILALDRSDEEREKNVYDFLEFYKANWKICDFKIENFSNSKNKADQTDFTKLLEYVKSAIE